MRKTWSKPKHDLLGRRFGKLDQRKRARIEQWSDAEIESEYRRRGLGNYSKTFRGIQLSDFPQVGSIVL